MPSSDRATDLAVLGAGPGGYPAAFLAADLGLRVTLVDPEENPGGVCLYRGCIPSKALLHAARLLGDARDAAELGIHFGEPRVDVERLRAWKDEVVGRLVGGLGQLARQRKVEYVRGRARFDGPGRLLVSGPDGDSVLRAERTLIATGSRPATLPGVPHDSPLVLDSTSALELSDVPRRVLVIGGGYIGLELGSVYAALGSRVSLVELLPSLLPGVDADLVRPLAKRVKEAFEAVHLETRLEELKEQNGVLRARLVHAGSGPERETQELEFDRALVAVGRRPNSEELGLETTKVRVDRKGFVEVDAQRRTTEPTIWAIGDVAGEPMLAHKATHEGRVAAEAIAGRAVAFEPRAIPAVVFTDPEVAWCGLSESDARAQGRAVKVVRFPWSASGRALTLARPEGVTKLVIDPESERVLGMGVCGPGAGELVAEGVLAVEMGARASDLALSIHAHPTLSETVMEAAELFLGHPTHVHRPRR